MNLTGVSIYKKFRISLSAIIVYAAQGVRVYQQHLCKLMSLINWQACVVGALGCLPKLHTNNGNGSII